MARTLYAGRTGDTVLSRMLMGDGRIVVGVPASAGGTPAATTLTVWDEPDGIMLTDLLAADGVTPITELVVPAGEIQIPAFYGPDGVTGDLWLKDPDGDYSRLDIGPVGPQGPAGADDPSLSALLSSETAGPLSRAAARDLIAGDIETPGSDVETAVAAKVQTVGDARFSQIAKRPVHAADYGVSAANSDNASALESALTAAAGVACHLPAGDLTIAKAGRLATVTAANSTLIGDMSAATVLRFTHASGGLDFGNGSAYVYASRIADVIIDGNAACATPLRIRKGEEITLKNVRIQNAVTSLADIADSSLMRFKELQLAQAPIGLRLSGVTGSITLNDANIYQVTEPIKVAGTSLAFFLYRDGWAENCPDLITFDGPGVSVGRLTVRDSHFTTSSASARILRAISGVVNCTEGELAIRECNFSWPSVTTPMVDFSAVDNSATTTRVALRSLSMVATAYGSQVLIKPHANQAWYLFYTDTDRIFGVPPAQWQAAYGVTGGVRSRPADLSGTGTPEGTIAAPVGSTYRREDGGAGTSLYVKESGAGNTGWVAK